MKPILSLASVALVLLGLVACSATAATTDVFIVNFDFVDSGGLHLDPAIQLGDDVHWTWSSGTHSTTSAAGQLESWSSGLQTTPFPSGFDHVFTHPGTFNYYCLLHGFDAGGGNVGGMSGHITVVPEPGTACLFLGGLGALGALWWKKRTV